MGKILIILVFLVFCFAPFITTAQENDSPNIRWVYGPAIGQLGKQAEVKIPENFLFADANDTRILMTEFQNPINGEELGFIGPESLEWFVVFEFSEVGYVNDEEKTSLDADAILESLIAANEESNAVRKERGWPIMTLIGWEKQPTYNEITHNLEWATIIEANGIKVVNFNTRILGRNGVMRVTLVVNPEDLQSIIPQYYSIMDGYTYIQGKKYTEFVQGDRIAEYGLTALVVGGAAAVATKTGIFKWLWKILLVGGAAIIAFFKKLFSKKTDK